MQKALVATLVSLAVCAGPQTVAASPITWTVSDTYYSGSFDYDVTSNLFSNISVTSTLWVPSVTYTAENPVFIPTALSFKFQHVDGFLEYSLLFNLDNPLTGAGGNISGNVLEGVINHGCTEEDCSTTATSTPVDLTAVTPVPEPASRFLLGSGLIGAGMRRYRQRRRD